MKLKKRPLRRGYRIQSSLNSIDWTRGGVSSLLTGREEGCSEMWKGVRDSLFKIEAQGLTLGIACWVHWHQPSQPTFLDTSLFLSTHWTHPFCLLFLFSSSTSEFSVEPSFSVTGYFCHEWYWFPGTWKKTLLVRSSGGGVGRESSDTHSFHPWGEGGQEGWWGGGGKPWEGHGAGATRRQAGGGKKSACLTSKADKD